MKNNLVYVCVVYYLNEYSSNLPQYIYIYIHRNNFYFKRYFNLVRINLYNYKQTMRIETWFSTLKTLYGRIFAAHVEVSQAGLLARPESARSVS